VGWRGALIAGVRPRRSRHQKEEDYMKRNILLLIHGMVPEKNPANPGNEIYFFWKNIRDSSSDGVLNARIPEPQVLSVEWGHQLPTDILDPMRLRKDKRIMAAENKVLEKIFSNWSDTWSPQAKIAHEIHKSIFITGVGDVIYFCGGEGEQQVREVVYQKLFEKLKEFENDSICLHIITHSLGVTISHDFLFNIFRTDHSPSHSQFNDQFNELRKKATDGNLELGTFICAASQLPLLLLRSQNVVDTLASGNLLNPEDVGVKGDKIQWLLFYDKRDLLSLPTKALYRQSSASNIREVLVENDAPGILPNFAASHTGYWSNATVRNLVREILITNTVTG
jgi:hypothetical protein